MRQEGRLPTHERGTPEARAARHASRAGTTYARFVREVASAGGYTMGAAERYAVGTIATLEERLPIGDVFSLEAQLPSRLDQLLSMQPLIGLPTMDREIFCRRVAQRVSVPEAMAEGLVRVVFQVLRAHISAGESRHVEAHLPDDLKALWTGQDL
jgi:uncharacterized protein (DUF2267 family)